MRDIERRLGCEIERAVGQIVAASHAAALAALDRAFDRRPRRGHPLGQRFPRAEHDRGEANGARRSVAELGALGERFLREVSAEPGQSMSVLAARVGVEPRALSRAVAHLRSQGRIRMAGQRQFTRYFPTGELPSEG